MIVIGLLSTRNVRRTVICIVCGTRQEWIAVGGRHEPIHPGMRVSAEIKTRERRVIEYLLSPVMQAVKEAGRER